MSVSVMIALTAKDVVGAVDGGFDGCGAVDGGFDGCEVLGVVLWMVCCGCYAVDGVLCCAVDGGFDGCGLLGVVLGVGPEGRKEGV